jgi:hypothetical protein
MNALGIYCDSSSSLEVFGSLSCTRGWLGYVHVIILKISSTTWLYKKVGVEAMLLSMGQVNNKIRPRAIRQIIDVY